MKFKIRIKKKEAKKIDTFDSLDEIARHGEIVNQNLQDQIDETNSILMMKIRRLESSYMEMS